MLIALHILYYIVGTVLVVCLIRIVLSNKRRLDKRIEEFHEETDNKPLANPWAALAELYGEPEKRNSDVKRGNRR